VFRNDNIRQFSLRDMVNPFIVAPVADTIVRANGFQYYLLSGFADGNDEQNLR
jgi:hypothetical protein